MKELVEKCGGFMGACDSYDRARIVLVGAPMDYTVSFRPGTRQGPDRIRSVSVGMEEYSSYLDRDLADYAYVDLGNIILPFGRVRESLRRIGAVTGEILRSGKLPLVLGGEHLISLPVIEQAAALYPGLAVIQFDAHADLREDYLGETLSHATVMRQVAAVVGAKNVYQLGIRSGTRAEFAYARENTNLFNDIAVPLASIRRDLAGRPVYVTLDIDVVDPAYAPGTGTPEPGGCTSAEIISALHQLEGLQVVGFDLVEVSPVYDHSERTALLAAKLVREAILCFDVRKNALIRENTI